MNKVYNTPNEATEANLNEDKNTKMVAISA